MLLVYHAEVSPFSAYFKRELFIVNTHSQVLVCLFFLSTLKRERDKAIFFKTVYKNNAFSFINLKDAVKEENLKRFKYSKNLNSMRQRSQMLK